jgi:ParB-like chromosome segregation protein Spo0J
MGWREKYKVHPAADVFPMMRDEELAALGADIKESGLKHPIIFDRGYDHDREPMLLDGRNRLEAMERAGIKQKDVWIDKHYREGDPVSIIIGLNIHRRHLTKQQQADLIVAAIKAGEKPDQVEPVSKGGRGKVNPVKAKAVAAGKEHDISEPTIKRAIAKAEGREPKRKSVEEIMAADEHRRAAAEATRERKKAEEAANRALEELYLQNSIAEFMGLLTPHLSHAEINRVLDLSGSLSWRWASEGFDYQGQHYGEQEDAEKGEAPLDGPAPDFGDIPAGSSAAAT